jgi:hypothetical protein
VAGLGDEPPRERARAHVRVAGEGLDPERFVQALERPRARRGEAVARLVGERAIDVLGLAAVAVRGDDVPARDRRRRVGAAIAANDVQAEVHPRREAGRREHVAVVDVQRVGIDVDRRELRSLLILPMALTPAARP